MGTIWQDRFAYDRAARCGQYSVLRRDGAENSLVAIRRLPNDFVYAVVHHSRRVWDCSNPGVACSETATRLMGRRCCYWDWWWFFDLYLLCRGVLDNGSSDSVGRGQIRINREPF